MQQLKKYILNILTLLLLSTSITLSQSKWTPITMSNITTFVPYYSNIILNSNQRYVADKIISIFENATTGIRYGYAEVVHDDEEHGITAGRLGFTSATGDILEFFKEYYNHPPFTKYIEELDRLNKLYVANGYEVSNNPNGSMNVDNLDGLIDDWHNEGEKSAFKKAQDKYLEEHYYIPAMNVANKVGLQLPLSLLCFYDTVIQHGVDGLRAIVADITLPYPKNKEEEILWIKQFNQKRLAVLKSKSYWKDTLYRVETLNDLLKDKKYFLNIDKIIIRSWDNEEFIIHDKQRSSNKINSLSASSTDSDLTLVMNGNFIEGNHIDFFIDADNNPNTGYTNGPVKGAEYFVEDTRLYIRPDGEKGWKWEKISDDIKVNLTSTTASSIVPIALLDIVENSIRFTAGTSKLNWKDSIKYSQMKELKIENNPNQNEIEKIGVRNIKSTPISEGTLFASPNGNGDCTKVDPCDIRTAFSRINNAGDVLFLRGGEYTISSQLLIYKKPATNEKPIIIESYPGEKAIIQGKFISGEYAKNHKDQSHVGIKIISDYTKIRNLQVRYMGHEGIMILHGNHNTIEGCELDHNILPGVVVYGGEWHEDNPKYRIPYLDGLYNIIQDNMVHDNSDIGLGAKTANGKPADGGNADGISISSGAHNKILHNEVYHNSDDGIDTWRSNDSYVAYNLSHDNGLGQGDGNGIKAGGNINPNAGNGRRTIVEHNIAYNNRARGFDWNAGREDIFRYNTAYNNKTVGFSVGTDSLLEYNIVSKNNISHRGKEGSKNSWNSGGEVDFITSDPHSEDFLKLKKGSHFEQMGAYANIQENENNDGSNIKIFVIGDSTVYNNDFPGKEMGWAQKEAFGFYMKNPKNLFDEARSGASSKSYKPHNDEKHDWQETKALIANTDTSDGGYLLIQFGHNDEATDKPYGTKPEDFYDELSEYVDWVKEHSITPVLITPVERRAKSAGNQNHRTHRTYAQKVRELAEDKNVLLLDLEEKSWNKYNKYIDSEDINNDLAYDDNTHFSPQGAKIVGGWVKDLICEKDEKLCSLFL